VNFTGFQLLFLTPTLLFMRKILTAFLLILGIVVSIYGQKAEGDTYILRTWLLVKDEMSGMGKHTPLDKQTEISFSGDGKWASSHPILNTTSGTWEHTKKGKYLVHIGTRKAEVESLSANQLVLQLEGVSNNVTWTWKPAN
jgi:hypothetical protein